MQKNISKKFFAIVFAISFACSQVKDPYVLSNLPNIQILEKQDHQFCDSLKLNFDERDNLASKFYWHCRLSLTKYRLYPRAVTPQEQKFNLEISDLITKISLKVSSAKESILLHQNKKMDSHDHKQCLVMGFVFDTEDQTKIDDYFSCRRSLIDERQLVPPFGKSEYLQYPNSSYNLGFAIDQRIDKRLQIYKEAKEKYPNCVKFNLLSANFKRCTEAQEKSWQCLREIDRKKFKKDGEEKTACQRESYLRFSDELLSAEDRRQKEIEQRNITSDFYNKQSFAALGITAEQFDSDEKRVKKEEEERQKKLQNINSKNGLYNRYELTKLRQKYIFSCQKNIEEKVESFAQDLKKYCEGLVEFEVMGE